MMFLAVLFIAALVVRLWGLSRIHYWDEMVYLQNAQVICCGKTNYSELSFRPPLISLFYAAIFKVWHSIYAACIGAALLNALAPVFLYLGGRLAVGRRASLIGSLLLALSPFFVGIFPAGFESDDTGNSLLTDSPALTLIALSFWLLLKAIGAPSFVRFFCGGISLALCILMRFGSLSTVAILLTLTVLSSSIWRALAATLSGLAVGIGPYLTWCSLNFGDPLFAIKEGWTHVEGQTESFTFFIRNSFVIFGPIVIVGLALYLVCSSVPLLSKGLKSGGLFGPQNMQLSVHMQAYLVAWATVAFLTFSLIPHKEPRYIMPAAPPLFLLSGVGLGSVFGLQRRGMRWGGCGGLCVSVILTILPLGSRLSRPLIDRTIPDEERAGKLLAATLPSTITLYMSFNYPTLAYYTNFRIRELSDLGPALYHDMEQVPPGEVLVVYREAEAPSQADTAWCDASHLFARVAEYPSLVVYRRL